MRPCVWMAGRWTATEDTQDCQHYLVPGPCLPIIHNKWQNLYKLTFASLYRVIISDNAESVVHLHFHPTNGAV